MSAPKPISDPVAAKVPNKDYPWFLSTIDHKITPEVRYELETYGGLPPGDVSKHIYAIREKAWFIRPYPCTGIGSFLWPGISRHPAYPVILARVRSGAKFLDVGCYMGHDLRRLVFDGAPESNLIGNDIVNHWDLGFELFNDRNLFLPCSVDRMITPFITNHMRHCSSNQQTRFHVTYVESDLLYPTEELGRLHAGVDIISITHVLHQWNWATQILACKELVALSKVDRLIVGYQGGTNDLEKRTQWNRENAQPDFTLHDPVTFRRMWDVVGEETGTKWSTEVVIVPWDELAMREDEVTYLGTDFALLRFAVARSG